MGDNGRRSLKRGGKQRAGRDIAMGEILGECLMHGVENGLGARGAQYVFVPKYTA